MLVPWKEAIPLKTGIKFQKSGDKELKKFWMPVDAVNTVPWHVGDTAGTC